MDHFGTHLQTFCDVVSKENDIEDTCSVMSNMSMEMENGVDLTLIEFMSPHKSNMEGIMYDGISKENANENATEVESPQDDEDENVPDVKGQPRFNKDMPWKKQLPILGMRFINPKQLKFKLCNYVVANGCQLYYKKMTVKDYRLIVVIVNAHLGSRLHGCMMNSHSKSSPLLMSIIVPGILS
uniref:Transposase MuDR plant domain-containing protein n=1 Tax=Lactuca sativa TaxID=4236 RepID=A0A9R1X9P1_LACSA|nr:hypothetical protein LSAT_V11C500261730 [Lactuca sativa]